jgi:hypothetical protein
MSPFINIKLQDYHSDVFINYKIISYDDIEWFIEISNDTLEKDTITIHGLDNLKDLIILAKETLSTISLSIVLDNDIVLFTERYVIIRENYLHHVFEIYKSMNINIKKRKLQVLKSNVGSSNVTNEIIKCLL